MKYRPEFHGIRALATILVIAVHTGLPLPNAGYIAVTIFFVLSGFLITLLLLEEFTQYGSIRLTRFYFRRALRLLPALYFLLGSMLTLGFLMLPSVEFSDLCTSCLYTLFSSSNWALAFNLNHISGLTHTWSLTVEQQFYLLWPLLLILLLQTQSRKIPQYITLLIGITTFSTFVLWNLTHDWNRIYFALDTHIPALLTGCLTALLIQTETLQIDQKRLNLIALSASTVIITAIVLLPSQTTVLHQGGLTGIAIATAGILLALYNSASPRLSVILSAKPLVIIGELSYSLYLWHLPITILYLKTYPTALPPVLSWLPPVTLTTIAALISYYVVERPFLKLKHLYGRPKLSSL